MKRETDILFKARAAVMLLVMLMTTATAWASELRYCENCKSQTPYSVIGNTATCTKMGNQSRQAR